MEYKTVPFNSSFNRPIFKCGKDPLDKYFHSLIGQDIKKKLCAGFILPEGDTIVKGYYTLANSSIARDMIPEAITKKIGKYPHLPVTLFARLAIDLKYQGQKLGELLLMDSLFRCFVASETIGSFAVIVDPIDEKAKSFYESYGFIHLPDSGKMFMTMATIKDLF